VFSNNIRRKEAFTLIELSIVLIIISLIVGGVIGGKSLLHSAKLKSVVAEYNVYLTAYNNFTLQYDDIPGDMVNATDYWPGVAVNGNGDKRISGAWLVVEGVNAWHHLSLAGLVGGTYVGSNGGYTGNTILNVTVPASKMEGKGWAMVDTGVLHGRQGNALGFMKPSSWPGGANQYPWGNSLSPRDALSIDKKIDDGDPRNGIVYIGTVIASWLNRCVNSTTGVVGLTYTTDECGLVFWLD